jgi:hypothetical protein
MEKLCHSTQEVTSSSLVPPTIANRLLTGYPGADYNYNQVQ